MHSLPKLHYPYDALEPYIDRETLFIHHTKHHQTYIDNLNNILTDHPSLQKTDIKTLLADIEKIPKEIRIKVINNGGGHYNHSLYWKFMSPTKSSPDVKLLKLLKKTFSGLDVFREKFSNAALTHFGSGWGWLVINNGNLEITSTSNQDSPISSGKIPLLAIDVWEHAYYLKYQNRRIDYIRAWWNTVNWDFISKSFENSL